MEIKFDDEKTPYVMLGEERIQLECGPVTEKFYKEKAETELRETPEIVEQALKELRELLKGEVSLNVPVENDEFLIQFLRPCKFYAESAFQRMRQYYQFRVKHEDYCRDLLPSSVRATFEQGVISFLAPRDQHGRRILVVESGENWNPRDVPLRDLFRGMQLALEAAMEEPRTQICGVVVILDMKGLSFTQVLQFTPSFAKMCVDWVQDCIPIRLKGVHIVNQPYIFNMLFALFKPFLRDKLRSRIHFHGSSRDLLHRHISKAALQARHGGTITAEIPGCILCEMLLHYEEQFRESNSYGYTGELKK